MTHNTTATTELDCHAAELATALLSTERTLTRPEGIGRTYRVVLYFYPTRKGNTRLKGFWGHSGSDFDAQLIDVRGGSEFADAWQRFASSNKAIKGFIAEHADTLLHYGYIDSKGNWSRLRSSKGDIMNALEICGYKTDCAYIDVAATNCCVCMASRIND